MKRLLFAALICLTAFALGCTSLPQAEFRQKIVGSWILDQSIMGERTLELLNIHDDGSFESRTLFKNGIGMVIQSIEQGQWAVIGNEVEFSINKTNGKASGTNVGARDQRLIRQLDNDVFVTADKKFGIEILRTRAPNGYSLPGWSERSMGKLAK